MLHAAPLGVGDREEYARVVGFFHDAGGGSHRQDTVPLDLVYHLHRLASPSIRYPLYSRRLHCASLAIRQPAHSLPSEPSPATVRRCVSAAERSHYPEDDPLLPLRQAGDLPQYCVRGLVGQGVHHLTVQDRLPLAPVHEVGCGHAEEKEARA